jgi:hypothetical protein
MDNDLKLDEYIVCERCNKKILRSQAFSDRFCSLFCKNSYSSRFNHNKKKLLKCNVCNETKYFPINISQQNAICTECRQKIKKEKDALIYNISCPYCGKIIKTKSAMSSHKLACKAKLEGNKLNKNYHKKDKRNGYIYLIRNKINNKIYIGKRASTPEETKGYYGSGIVIKKAIAKHGKYNFSKTILEIIVDGNLNEREKFWIKKYNSINLCIGYNLTEGGDGGGMTFLGRHHTKLTKQKMSASLKRH